MRADLAALTPETLAELTNRGLVKRATREVERAAPALSDEPDGTVVATFADGVSTRLPAGGLEAGRCTCGATGVCRHVVAVVLAYKQARADRPGDAAPEALGEDGPSAADSAAPIGSDKGDWSPGDFTDEQLTARIGARMMAAARRIERAGYVARVHRRRPGDPVPSVDLPTATVRFLVPGDLGFARTDAASGVRDDVIALAVWAFRAADQAATFTSPTTEAAPGPTAGEVAEGRNAESAAGRVDPRVADRGGEQAPDQKDRDGGLGAGRVDHRVDGAGERAAEILVQVGGGGSAAGSGLDSAVALADAVLLDGAVHVGAGIVAQVVGVRRELESARLRWPLLAVEDLDAQLTAYRERSARYRPEALADHLSELHARHRAVTGGGASLRSRVLGTDEASETPLRRARLDGLGARVSAAGPDRIMEIYLAHADSATVLVLRRSWETDQAGPQLAARRIAGVTAGALAAGTVVTESAVRSASRTVRLGVHRLSRTEALTSRGSWPDLPRALIADDLAALTAELDALPPRPVRARVQAELVRVLPIAEVRSIRYAPGSQRLDAVIADAHGRTALISAVHESCAPGRLDAVAATLDGDVRFVAGTVRRGRGGVVIDPLGFAADDRVVVPDLAAPTAGADPDNVPSATRDALSAAIDEAAALLAEIAHRGLRHVPSTISGRLQSAATRLSATGMHRAGATVAALASHLGPDPGTPAIEAWTDAYLRLTLAADLR